jgi:MOSC domain-containing protein YiiM
MVINGQISSIFIRPEPSEPVIEIDQVLAVPGKGIEGDYYFAGIAPKGIEPAREITLIEKETLQALETEHNISLSPAETRRNLITEKVPLNNLVGKEFRVGNVTLRGIRLCEPCAHLASLTQQEVLPALVHRGGLRAQILTKGIIHVRDTVSNLENIPDEEVIHAEPDQ